jgi:surface protein
MSTRNILGNTEAFKSLGNRTIPPIPTQENIVKSSAISNWYRNPSWLPLPTISDTEEKFVGLVAVFPDANFIALTALANYTVDWGDGTTQNFNSGAQANYEYSFSDADLNNTNAPVTFQDAGDTVTRNNHGYTNGMTVSFSSITTTSGIVAGQIYFVVGATTNTFQVAATSGGSALPLTNDGTGIILPYKQVIVTVTPQAGQNLISLNLQVRNNSAGAPAGVYTAHWLDIAMSMPNCTGLTLGAQSPIVRLNLLEQISLVNIRALSSMSSLFRNCTALRSIPIINSHTALTNTSNMFTACTALQTVPLFNTANVTNMNNMFNACRALKSVPLFNTANVTDMSSMFINCASLQTVPLFNTVAASAINMSNMFTGCVSLQTVPLFNTVRVTSMGGMFSSCTALQTVPLFNTAAVTTMSGMFNGCASLQTVPLFNTALVNNTGNMFTGCTSLLTVPLFNTAAVTNMSGMFNNCSALLTVPLFNTALVTNMGSMFNGCTSLLTVPLFNMASMQFLTNMFASCISLQTVPLFNTASVLAFGGMFTGCTSLQSVPLFNAASATGMSFMFNNCTSLVSVPAINANTVISSADLGTTFGSCTNLSQIDMTNIRFTFSVASCKLSAAALNNIYTNLPTVSGQTITVTGNYGTVTYDPTIATAKGWTVSG